MPGSALLIVVVVRDSALRARLARALDQAGVRRATLDAEGDLILLDENGLAGEAGQRIEAQWLAGRWRRVIVLTIDAPVPAGDREWLAFVEHGSAAERLSGLIDEWRAIAAA